MLGPDIIESGEGYIVQAVAEYGVGRLLSSAELTSGNYSGAAKVHGTCQITKPSHFIQTWRR
jgi:hypothetical protein